MIESFVLFWIVRDYLALPLAQVQALIFLKLLVSGHMTIYLTRNTGPVWERPWPSWKLVVPAEATQLVGTLAVVYGWFMAPSGWPLALHGLGLHPRLLPAVERDQDRRLPVAGSPRRPPGAASPARRKTRLGVSADATIEHDDAKGSLMKRKSSVKSAELSLTSVPAFWPMAMATAMMEEGAELYAKNLKFVDEEIKIHDELRPVLATPNKMRLDLRTMALRDYGKPGGIPTLVDAPHAGHTAMIADYHKGQSLVQTLLANGIGHVALTDWKSATDGHEGPGDRQLPRRDGRRDRRSRRPGQSRRAVPGRLGVGHDRGALSRQGEFARARRRADRHGRRQRADQAHGPRASRSPSTRSWSSSAAA